MSLRRIGLILSLVFAVALAVVVGSRMSAEAMAVVVGVVCGVAAGIPTSVLLMAAMSRRERHQYEKSGQQRQAGNYPPVVVIQGGAPQALPPGQQAGYWPSLPPGPQAHRHFHVVGGEELTDDGRY
jgi:anti-sigma factor RsiW